MADKVKLLDFWLCSFATRVKIALSEKGIDYESREEDLSSKSPLLLKMNPVGKQIPVLIHNGKPVCESLIIVEYIDEVWNHKSPLLPSDPYKRALARFWADYVDNKIHSLGKLLFTSEGEAQEAAKNDLIECFKLLEGELGDKPYFGGETFGFVDVALISFHCFFYTYEESGNFSMATECPKLVAWAHRCMEKESVSKTHPERKVHDFLLKLKKKLEAKMVSEVILLDYWPSPFATRVRIALAEKGIDYESKDEDMVNKSPLLMEMNPIHKKVPVLIHNGKPICESDIIIQYIDDVWKDHQSPLFPSDPYLKAQARFWANFVDTKVYESSRKVWMGKGEDQETGKEELIEWCKLLEGELGDKSYFGVETLGFVDIALVPFYNWFIFFKTFADFSFEAECPKLVSWGKRCFKKDSVSKSLPNPDQIYAAYLEFQKRL